MKIDVVHKFASLSEEELDHYQEKYPKNTAQHTGRELLFEYLSKTKSGIKIEGGDSKPKIPNHVLVVTCVNTEPDKTKLSFKKDLIDKFINDSHKVIFFIEFIRDLDKWRKEVLKESLESIKCLRNSTDKNNTRLYFRGAIPVTIYNQETCNFVNNVSLPYSLLEFDLIFYRNHNPKLDFKDPGIRFYRNKQYIFDLYNQEIIAQRRQALLEEVHRLQTEKIEADPDALINKFLDVKNSTSSIREKVETVSITLLKLFVYVYADNQQASQWFIKTEINLFKMRLRKLYLNSTEDVIIQSLALTDLFKEGSLEWGEITDLAIPFQRKLYNAFGKINTPNYVTDCKYFIVCKMASFLKTETVDFKNVFIHNGLCFFSYMTLYNYMVSFYSRIVSYELTNKRELKRMLATMRALSIRPFKSLYVTRNTIIKRAVSLEKGEKQFNLLNMKADSETNLPDIEECYTNRLFPLCTFNIIWRLLNEKDHLKHWERIMLGWFLLELGYGFKDIEGFLGTRDMKFSKYRTELIPMKSKNNESRFVPKGTNFYYPGKLLYNCAFYTSGNFRQDGPDKFIPGKHNKMGKRKTTEKNDYTGCPFEYLFNDMETLKKHLKAYGLVDTKLGENKVEDVLSSVRNREFMGACLKTYEYTHGKTVIESGNFNNISFSRPSEYFKRSYGLYKQMKHLKIEPT
jgi:hypothetical protein